MRYVCLGYMDEVVYDAMNHSLMNAYIDESTAFIDDLREHGVLVAIEALQRSNSSVIVRQSAGKPAIFDGPFAETKEQLGGFMVIEAVDLNHAIALISKNPSLRYGCSLEIRSLLDLDAIFASSAERRMAASILNQKDTAV